MNLQFYIEKLHSSEVFKKFKKENPKAYLCSGFFTIDKDPKSKDDQVHFDFFIPESKDVISFDLKGKDGVEILPSQTTGRESEQENKFVIKSPSNIDNIDFDFEKIEPLIQKKMDEQKIKNKIQKILISLQNIEDKNTLVCTVFISGFGLLKANIDLDTFNITEFEKKSFFDLIKKAK